MTLLWLGEWGALSASLHQTHRAEMEEELWALGQTGHEEFAALRPGSTWSMATRSLLPELRYFPFCLLAKSK